jgi:hypothetical protein
LNSLRWGESEGNVRFFFGHGERLTFFLTRAEEACDLLNVVHNNL